MGPKITPVAPTITQAAELAAITDDAFPMTFLFNVNRICEYSDLNITAILETRKVPVLNNIRDQLLSQIASTLPDYATKKGRKGQDKPKICKDIITLTKSIVKNKPDADLDSVFKDAEPQLDLTNQDNLIAYVKQMKTELSSTKSELYELKTENQNLWTILKSLNIEQKLPTASESSDTPNSSSSSEADCESDTSEDEHLKNRKKPKKSTLKGQPKKLEGVPKKTYAFIGNVKSHCTSSEVFDHIRKNTSIKIEQHDIQEYNTVSKTKAFKIAVDVNDLQNLTRNTKWPRHVKAEPFAPPKRKNSPPPKQNSHPKNKRNNANRRRQKFRSQNNNSYRGNPNRDTGRSYRRASDIQYHNDYQPGGSFSGYYRSDNRR